MSEEDDGGDETYGLPSEDVKSGCVAATETASSSFLQRRAARQQTKKNKDADTSYFEQQLMTMATRTTRQHRQPTQQELPLSSSLSLLHHPDPLMPTMSQDSDTNSDSGSSSGLGSNSSMGDGFNKSSSSLSRRTSPRSSPTSPRNVIVDLQGFDAHHHHHHGEHLQDPLKPAAKKAPPTEHQRPGVQFCQAHDKLAAKLAAFDDSPNRSYDYSSKTWNAVPNDNGGGYVSPTPTRRRIIEIAPGITAHLRGAQETWDCIVQDFYSPVTCFCCTTNLCCILDARYVLCPVCRVVSPMEGGQQQDDNGGGVGLGFTLEDLRQWQYEILMKQRDEQRHGQEHQSQQHNYAREPFYHQSLDY